MEKLARVAVAMASAPNPRTIIAHFLVTSLSSTAEIAYGTCMKLAMKRAGPASVLINSRRVLLTFKQGLIRKNLTARRIVRTCGNPHPQWHDADPPSREFVRVVQFSSARRLRGIKALAVIFHPHVRDTPSATPAKPLSRQAQLQRTALGRRPEGWRGAGSGKGQGCGGG